MSQREKITPWPCVITDGTGLPHPSHATVETVVKGGHLPYHAIFSRGMMQRWAQSGWATEREELGPEAQWWHTFAPLLEDAWNFWRDRSEIRGPDDTIDLELVQSRIQIAARQLYNHLIDHNVPQPDLKPYTSIPAPILAGMVRAALDAGVRSYDQGLVAAIYHLAHDGGAALAEYCHLITAYRPSPADIRQVELANLKEGHTSSVVRVAVQCHEVEDTVLFCLNVARDLSDTADELEVNRRDLVEWAALDPDGVAEVYGTGVGRVLWFGREAHLPIVAVKWFEGFRELHVARNPSSQNFGIFILVDEFQQVPGALPKMIGPQMDETTSDRLWSAIVAKRTSLAHIDWQSGTIETPDLELNHGDVVAEIQGEEIRIAFVASSTRRWRGPIGAWPYEMAISSARDDRSSINRRTYWGKPIKALRAIYEGILQQLPSDGENIYKQATGIFESALAIEVDRLSSYLSLSSDNGEIWPLLFETRREILSFLNQLDAGVRR